MSPFAQKVKPARLASFLLTIKIKYSVVQKKVTILLSTSLAWPAWAG